VLIESSTILFLAAHWQGMITGGVGGYVIATVVKWIPTWPLSWEKVYNWLRSSAQDIVSHYQGGPGSGGSGPSNPIKPA